jgi:hypothetical protein
MTDDRWRLEEFRRLLDISERAVVFTGAGISTESGIPDFRSPGPNTALFNITTTSLQKTPVENPGAGNLMTPMVSRVLNLIVVTGRLRSWCVMARYQLSLPRTQMGYI